MFICAKVLYTDHVYLSSLYHSLTGNGILVAQVGESPNVGVGSEADENGSFVNRSEMIKMLDEIGFLYFVKLSAICRVSLSKNTPIVAFLIPVG